LAEQVRVIEMGSRGMTPVAIARELDIDVRRVYYILRNSPETEKRPRRRTTPEEAARVLELNASGLTLREIVAIVGIGPDAARRVIIADRMRGWFSSAG
jgi:hypothetical protein